MSREAGHDAAAGRATAWRASQRAGRTRVGTVVAAVVSMAIVVAFLVMPLLGLNVYVITGGSMHGSIEKGAVIFSRTVPSGSLRVGDIITFRPPQGSAPVTHRIISVEEDADGRPVFLTKGDANDSADPWQFTLDRPVQAKYVAQIPYLGYAIAVLTIPIVRGVLFAIPALLAVLWLFTVLWRRSSEAEWLGRSRDAVPQAEEVLEPRQFRRASRRGPCDV
jgi:signal peptidase I